MEACRCAVTVEDHTIIGGLGSAIAEFASETHPVPIIRVGLRDVFSESGKPDELLDKYQIGVTDVVAAAKKVMDMKNK